MIEIKEKEKIIAIIIPNGYEKEGVSFFTPNDFSQQLAYMQHPAGKIIEPHVHNLISRKINYTQEVLIIKKGKLRVDFYADNKKFLSDYTLEAGDVILLASGGHGFEVIEDLEMIEVKQGPYIRDVDKVKFIPKRNK